jgi:hypothetical protein
LPLLLSRSGLHLTRFSAVTLEAAAFGLTTLAISGYAQKLFSHVLPPHRLHIEADMTRVPTAIRRLLDGQNQRTSLAVPNVNDIVPFLKSVMARSSDAASQQSEPIGGYRSDKEHWVAAEGANLTATRRLR